jgi:hypothetical protein
MHCCILLDFLSELYELYYDVRIHKHQVSELISSQKEFQIIPRYYDIIDSQLKKSFFQL